MKFLLSIIILFVFYTTSYSQQIKIDPPAEKGDPPISKFGGLQIYRADLIKQLVSCDSSFSFKQTGEVDGNPVFSAIGTNGSHVEIIGTENNIRKAKWTMIFSSERAANGIAFKRVAYFLTLICLLKKDVLTWYDQQLGSLQTMVNSPDPTPSAFTVINADKFTFTFLRSEKGISLTVVN